MTTFATKEVLDEIDRQAKQFGVSPTTAKALFVAENTGSGSLSKLIEVRGDAVSPRGARGVMQVMPETADGLKRQGYLPANWTYDPTNLSSSVAAGLAALKEKMTRMKNPDDLGEVASVYNGSTATHRAYKEGNFAALPAETRQYINKLQTATSELTGKGKQAMPGLNEMTVTPTASTTGRITTRRSVSDPEAVADFTNTILEYTQPGGTFDVTAQVLKDQADARELASGQLKNAITTQATAAGAEAMAKTAVTGASAARRMQILRDLNLDPAANNNAMMQEMGIIEAADNELAAMKPEIDARMSVGFFDNPLEWFVNQTRLPGMVAKYNSTVDNSDNAAERYKKRALIASTQQSLSAATEADLIYKEGVATASKVAAAAVADAAKIDYESAGNKARDQLTLMQLGGQKVQMLGNLMSTTKQSVSETVGMTERQRAEKEAADDLANVNALIAMAKGKPLAQSLFNKLPGASKQELVYAASTGKFGADFASSFGFVDKLGDKNSMAVGGGAAVATWLDNTTRAAGASLKQQQDLAKATGKPFNMTKALPDALNAIQEKYEVEAAVDMRTASTYNPMKLDYVTISKMPELQNNPVAIWINTYGPKGTKPLMGTVDEQFLVNKFTSGIVEGKYSAAVAAKAMADYYQFATKQQAVNTSWPLFGLAKPVKGYAVQLSGKGQSVVDFTDAAELEAVLTVKVASDLGKIARDNASGLMDNRKLTSSQLKTN